MAKHYSERSIKQMFNSIFPAVLLSFLMPALSSIMNGVLIGNAYGKIALAAFGFVAPLTIAINAITGIFASGSKILCGHYIGKGNKSGLNDIFTTSVMSVVIIGVVCTVAIELFPMQISKLLGADSKTINETASYLRGFFIGFTPTLLIPVLSAFLTMQNHQNNTKVSAVLLTFGNLGLALLNIFIFKFGMFGIGLSTSIAQFITCIYLAIVIFANKDLMRFSKKGYKKDILAKMSEFGLPEAIKYICAAIRLTFTNYIMMKYCGSDGVAALAIMSSAVALLDVVEPGISSTSQIMSSVFYGERDSKALAKLHMHATKMRRFIIFPIIVLYIVFSSKLAVLFGAKDNVIKLAAICIIFYAITIIFSSYNIITLEMYQSFGRIKLATIMLELDILVYPTILLLILPRFLGIYGIIGTYLLDEIINMLVIFFIAAKKNGYFPKNSYDILWLGKNFEFDKKQRLFITASKLREAVTISKIANSFCLSNGIDNKRSYHTALCIESIADNIFSYGYEESGSKNKRKKKKAIDIFVYVENNEVNIQIRDNAKIFDPCININEIKSNKDVSKNIGTKIIYGLTKEIEYKPALGMNVLNIKI